MALRRPRPDGRGTIEGRAVTTRLARWEAVGLVRPEQAAAIRAYEHGLSSRPPRGIPPVAELLGYVGIALVVAAVVTLIGRIWEDLPRAVQLLVLGAVTLLSYAAGRPIHRHRDPAVTRLSGVVWTLSAAALVLFLLSLLVVDVERPAPWTPFAIAATVAVYSGALLARRPSTPLQLAVFASALSAVLGVGAWAIELGWTWLEREGPFVGAAVLWVASVGWTAAGARGVLEPRSTAIVVGSVGIVVAPQLAFEGSEAFTFASGVIVAAVLLVAAIVVLRQLVVLGVAAIALVGYATGASLYFLGDSVGAPVALFVAGLVVAGIAVLTARARPRAGGRDATTA